MDAETQIAEALGTTIDVEHAYNCLTARGWKIDTEESNLMQGFSRVWRGDGVKVWVFLDEFVCAPPSGEQASLERVTFYRFDPAAMPTATMLDLLTTDDDEPRSAAWHEEWRWLIDHGDPQFATFDLLTEIPTPDVPLALLDAACADLVAAGMIPPT